jgi:DNA-directed RNA polymerase specialized sigma24 family protein
MDQEHRSPVPDHAGFDATRWSLVLEAAQSRADGGPEALARLCERYWPPLYAFARHRGFSPEDAQDLVQGFFEHLIESRALSAVDQAKGRFRSFLLASFQNFTAMERRRADTEKRGGRAQMIRIDWQDAEGKIAFEPKDPLTPETVYDARWALALLCRATRRLEQEQAALDKAEAFCTLRLFLGDQGVRAGLSYEAAAQALNVYPAHSENANPSPSSSAHATPARGSCPDRTQSQRHRRRGARALRCACASRRTSAGVN